MADPNEALERLALACNPVELVDAPLQTLCLLHATSSLFFVQSGHG
jgi:hypothetical protein